MKTFVWCEDSGSGLQFWREIFAIVEPKAIVESKKNNSLLCQYVSKIGNDSNRYFILMDTVLDNPNVIREVKRLKKVISHKNNVVLLDVISFEYVLLSFQKLEQWVFAENDALRIKRLNLIKYKNIIINEKVTNSLKKYNNKHSYLYPYAETHNFEQIYARLLFEITRNTGFETNKKQLGICFYNDCCDWPDRQSDDICGLDNQRLSSLEKRKQIIEYSILKEVFKENKLL